MGVVETYHRPQKILPALLDLLQCFLLGLGTLHDAGNAAGTDVLQHSPHLVLGGSILGNVELELLARSA